MNSTFQQHEDIETGQLIFTLRLDRTDMVLLELSEFDNWQLGSKYSEETPIADRLLDLELVVRRLEEKHARNITESDNSRRKESSDVQSE